MRAPHGGPAEMIDTTHPLELRGADAGLTATQWIAIICGGWVLVILSLVLPDLWHAPLSLVQDDARHHVVWLRHLFDPEIYADDPTARFFLSQSPIAYQALFVPASWFAIDVITWHFLVLVPLTCLLSTCAIYRFTTHFLPTTQQRGLVTLILCMLLAASAMQGLQRNFSLAIFLFAWVAYLERRVFLAGLVFLVGANIYPVAAVTAGFSILIHLITLLKPDGFSDRRAVLTVAVGGLAGIAGLVPFLLSSAGAGPTLLLEEARNMTILQDGRSTFFKPSLWDQLLCRRTGGASIMPICIRSQGDASGLTLATVVAAIAVGWICYRRLLLGSGCRDNRFARQAARVALSLFVAGTVLFAAAYAVAFRLYLPDRYAFLTIGLIFWFCLAILLCTVMLGIAKLAGHLVPPIRPALPLAVVGVVWIAFVANAGGGFSLHKDPEPEISAFLRASPKTTVVAGFDSYLDSIPAHAMRSSFAAIELILPYKTDYFSLMRDRTFRLRDAFATSSAKDISTFAAKENISFFLLPPGELQISGRWTRSFPSLLALEGAIIPLDTSPGGTECVVITGRNVNLVDAACLGGGS